MLKIGTRVRITKVYDNVDGYIQDCVGMVGTIVAYSDHTAHGYEGYYVNFEDDTPTYRFYANEIEVLNENSN